MLSVSIVIPAYNAADTLAETLESFLAQTYPHWEAIVVDDGSTDETAAIAEKFAAQDSRVLVIHQPNGHVSAARNVGIQAAKFDWLLFNDGDDWLAPTCLEKLTAVLVTDPALDVVHCGWTRVTQSGKNVTPKYAPDLADMFLELGYYCAFQINACIIRKIAVEAVGGFDAAFIPCEDWDLLQRIARVGARFASVREVLSFYRMQPNSLSSQVEQLYRSGLRVLKTTHGIDPRINHLHPDHELGLPTETLTTHQFYFATWCAGVLLGQGKDARSLLDVIETPVIETPSPVLLEPKWIAECLFESIPIPTSQDFSQWDTLWEQFSSQILQFLQVLSERTQIKRLADRALYHLEQKILDHCVEVLPRVIGQTYGVTIEITNPILPIELPIKSLRVYSRITLDGSEIGYLTLPVLDGKVADWVIVNAITSQFTEPILNYFLPQRELNSPAAFLQQLWHRPDWPLIRFYDSECPDMGYDSPTITVTTDWIALDLKDELPHLKILSDHVRVGLWLAGERIGALSFAGNGVIVTPQRLRSAFTRSFEPALKRAFVKSLITLPALGKRQPEANHQNEPLENQPLGVSIVIPAYNAEKYLRQTLASLLAQTYPYWEAMIIDDGSLDGTSTIAAEFALRDSRIRWMSQSNQGGCAARNHGLQQAYFDWVVFLDADDWWDATYLEKMTQQLCQDMTLDGIRCYWYRVTTDGQTVLGVFPESPGRDVFESCVESSGWQIDTCIVQRAFVESVGGFDIQQKARQDTDLWQRIARMGARFGMVPEVLSFYRAVPSSVVFSSGGWCLLENCLKVIARGYTIDPRVPHPDPRYAIGLDPQSHARTKFYLMLWCAGLEILTGQDARFLLLVVPDPSDANVSPEMIRDCMQSSFWGTGLAPDYWYTKWPDYEPRFNQFLAALEAQLNIPGLKQKTLIVIQHSLLQQAPLPQQLGAIQGITLDIAQPVPEILTDSNTDQLYCLVTIAGEKIGELWLPILDQKVSAQTLADVVAGEYFWWILAHFFRWNVYSSPEEMEKHDQIGWVYFLRELFEQPDRNTTWFYQTEDDPNLSIPPLYLDQPICTIEMSQDLPPLQLNPESEAASISVVLTVGGKPIGVIPVPVENYYVSVAMLRSTLLTAGGIELCRVCVREAILGQPLQTGLRLRARLQAAASQAISQAPAPIDPNSLPPIGSCWLPKRTSRFA
jgi:glycosyltransferase involved in cell wall biosynthesis